MKIAIAEMEKMKQEALKKATLIVPYCDGKVILSNHMRADTRIKEILKDRQRAESARKIRDNRFGGTNAPRRQGQSYWYHRDTQPKWVG